MSDVEVVVAHRERATLRVGDVFLKVDGDAAISGWWSLRCLTAIRWLVEHGFDPAAPGCEIDVLRAQAADAP